MTQYSQEGRDRKPSLLGRKSTSWGHCFSAGGYVAFPASPQALRFRLSSAFQLVLVSVFGLLLAYCLLEISWVAWPSESSTAHSTSGTDLSPCTHQNREYHSPTTTANHSGYQSYLLRMLNRFAAGWSAWFVACFV